MDSNHLYLTGNLIKEPELKFSAGGVAFLRCVMANNHYYSKKDGVETKKVNFIEFTLFGKMAEKYAEFLHKGTRVALDGSLEVEVNTNDGKTFTKVKCNVAYVSVLEDKKNSQKNSSTAERRDSDRERFSDTQESVGNVAEESFDDDDSFPF